MTRALITPVLLCGLYLLAGCGAAHSTFAPAYSCEIVNRYPHDVNAFTQGLVYHGGYLYEGTGLNGLSSIRRVELTTGRVLQEYDLPWQYFGEGITIWQDRLIQLTWTSGIAFAYDRDSFELQSTFSYPTSGWGLTHDGARLIMSDGSSTLYFRAPDTFAEIGRIHVTDGGRPVRDLNELEFIRGELWANLWGQYRIARICLATGRIRSWIDISNLRSPVERLLAGSPNGIAYDADGDRIFLTGKNWPHVFEITVNMAVAPSCPALSSAKDVQHAPFAIQTGFAVGPCVGAARMEQKGATTDAAFIPARMVARTD
ncbi:MAG TPA: glutaminyl-peptide cyclotransferase [Phycisphaerae bacterium]|mgnify:CR=1 FL=1|nr:glutaminyl-peptide cyclotransferase [Phycisphaerae bacterium]HOM52053.1 glutaminyl-peptide cyclotransferase [Phycisphaerae bacterium]HOQ87777.1 glutaminyl-peptide cyclotransferase [Phycisphaerae bacterium]